MTRSTRSWRPGRLESDQVDDYKAAAEQRVRDWLAGTYEGKRGKGHGRVGGKGVGLVSIVSEETGVSTEDIRTRLSDGDSLSDIIEEADGDVTAVTDAAMEVFETRLTAAIENGRVDAEKADELRESMRERIESALEAEGRRPHEGSRQVWVPRLWTRARSLSPWRRSRCRQG